MARLEVGTMTPIISNIQGLEVVLKNGQAKAKVEQSCLSESWVWARRSMGTIEDACSLVIGEPKGGNATTPIKNHLALTDAPVDVLDLMGFGTIYPEMKEHNYRFAHGISMSLGRPSGYRDSNPDVDRYDHIEGNILLQETWNALRNTMNYHAISKFGLVIWMPLGGFESMYITGSIAVYNELLRRTWDLVSVKNGWLLAEIPPYIQRDYSKRLDDWMKEVQKKTVAVFPKHLFARYLVNKNGHYDSMMLLEKTPLMRELPVF